MSTIILTRREVSELLSMSDALSAIEQAFRDQAEGKNQMQPKTYITLEDGDFRAMPAAVPGAAGIKWVNVHPKNHRSGLRTVMGVLIYSDPATGYPLAVMDATEITSYRTAATSALASRYLARSDSRVLGLVGAGCQARMHIESHRLVFDLELVKVHDACPEAVEGLARERLGLEIVPASPEEAADSDILCTLTPSRQPIVMAGWIKPGTHINAVGADARGKQELDPQILGRSRVVVDDAAQACHSGEINVPVSAGAFSRDGIAATLSEIVSGRKAPRDRPDAVTVFDSTGLAIEDVAVAKMLYQKALTRDGLMRIDLV